MYVVCDVWCFLFNYFFECPLLRGLGIASVFFEQSNKASLTAGKMAKVFIFFTDQLNVDILLCLLCVCMSAGIIS